MTVQAPEAINYSIGRRILTLSFPGEDPVEPLEDESLSLDTGPLVETGPSEYTQYVLQAGSFRAIADADRRRGELALLGLESSIEQMNTDTGSWHRVYIGPFDSRSAMAKARALTAQSDIDTLLLKRAQ